METSVRILKVFLESDAPVSGARLAGELGLSRTAIWKGVAKLKAEGVAIEAIQGVGYRLRGQTHALGPSLISAALTTKRLGRPVYYFSQTDSTNLRAKELAGQGAPSGTLVIADFQTAGRGRLDRTWLSPPRTNLLFSLILRPNLEVRGFSRLTMAAAVSLAEAVEGVTGLSPGVKWPNDLLVKEAKLAGILTEISGQAQALDWAVVGVGLNVSDRPPQEPAVCLAEAIGGPVDRLALLDAFLNKLERLLAEGLSTETIQELWRKRSVTLGRVVTVMDGQTKIRGRALDVDEDGALLVETPGGVRRINCGDVHL